MGLGTGATAAIVGGIGAAGSVASGLIGSHAAGQAADAQAGAANHAADLQAKQAADALAFQKQVYGDQQTNQRPFLQAGQGATFSLANLLGIRMPQMDAPPQPGQPSGGGGIPGSGTGNPFIPGIGPVPSRATGGPDVLPFQADGNTPSSPNINRLRALQGNSAMLQTGQNGVPLPTGSTNSFNVNQPNTSPGTGGNTYTMKGSFAPPPNLKGEAMFNPGGTQLQMQPPITSGGTTGQAGAAGMIQTGPDGQPTGVTPEFNPGQVGPLNLNPSSNNGTPTPTNGSPGTVPRTDGLPTGAVTGPDGTVGLGDPSPFGTGGIGDLNGGPASADDNSFGSLLRGYGQQFVAPTAVTEQNDPGYQFRLQQGNDAIQRSAAARGGLLSGGTAKALTDYAQGSASQEYGNVYNRALSTFDNNYNQFNNDQTNKFNRLASLAGFGQTAAGQLSTAGSNAANNVSSTLLTSGQQIGNDIQNAGAARASGYVGGANAVNGAIGGGTNSLTNAILLSQYL